MPVPAIAVADTHAFIWWITDQRQRLGRRANAFFDAVDAGQAVVCIPAMVLVDLDETVRSSMRHGPARLHHRTGPRSRRAVMLGNGSSVRTKKTSPTTSITTASWGRRNERR
jgi:hypothetical protein